MCCSRLLGSPGDGNAKLTRLPVKIWTLDAKSLSGVCHPPPVMLKHGRDVIAFEAQPRLPQIAGRGERLERAVEFQGRQDVLDLNPAVSRFGSRPLDHRSKLG